MFEVVVVARQINRWPEYGSGPTDVILSAQEVRFRPEGRTMTGPSYTWYIRNH